MDANDLGVGRWVFEHRPPAGLGTATLPGASALYLPLLASRGPVGVLGIRPVDRHALDTPEQLHQLETFGNQTALAIERANLAAEAQDAQIRIESERLRNSLLSSVSHDLRTPLTTITGAVSTILDKGSRLDDRTQKELLESAREEAERLNRLVQNLLEMTRLESGALQLRKEWHPLEEVIGAALSRLDKRLANRRVTTHVPPDLPLVAIDDVLIEQVLVNLLDNAIKYTPLESPIRIIATATDRPVTVEVADPGPGLPRGDDGSRRPGGGRLAPAGRRHRRPRAARHRRHRRHPPAPGVDRGPDHRAVRSRSGARQGDRPRCRRRRLCEQALRRGRAPRADPRRAPPYRGRVARGRRRDVPGRGAADGSPASAGLRRRPGGAPDADRVQAPGGARPARGQGRHARAVAP